MHDCKICGRAKSVVDVGTLCAHCDYLEEYALPGMPLQGLIYFRDRIDKLIDKEGE